MNNRIALITADRGDRPEFLKHCIYQMTRQTVKADIHLIINSPGKPGIVDIVPRIRHGIAEAKDFNAKYCLIIENDDYYPDDYVETVVKFLERFDLVGMPMTKYYSLQQNSWKDMVHPGRSSLYLTSFRTEAMTDFAWPADDLLYFDIHLWQHFRRSRGFINHFKQVPIGMKHGKGFSPGNFHNCVVNGKKMNNMTADPGRAWLKSHVRPESFEFYQSLSL